MIIFDYLKKCLIFLLSTKLHAGLQLLLGFYAERSPRKNLIRAEKIYCITLNCIIPLIYFIKVISGENYLPIYYTLPYVGVYIFSTFISFVTKGMHCHKYCSDLRTVDTTMGYESPSTCITASVILVLLFTTNAVFVYQFCIVLTTCGSEEFALTVIMISIGAFQTYKVVLFDMFQKRMKLIHRQLASKINSSDKNTKINAITKCLIVYKNLMVAMESTMGVMRLAMIADILYAIFHSFIGMMNIINDLRNGGTIGSMTTILRLHDTIPIWTLAVLAEMVLYDYDEIKGLLATQLLYCSATDTELRAVIHESLDYLESRAPRFTIWRIFKLDISLPITFFNLCITFTILMLQYKP